MSNATTIGRHAAPEDASESCVIPVAPHHEVHLTRSVELNRFVCPCHSPALGYPPVIAITCTEMATTDDYADYLAIAVNADIARDVSAADPDGLGEFYEAVEDTADEHDHYVVIFAASLNGAVLADVEPSAHGPFCGYEQALAWMSCQQLPRPAGIPDQARVLVMVTKINDVE